MSTATTKTLVMKPSAAEFSRFSFFGALAIVIYTTMVTLAYATTSPMGDVMCAVLGFVYGNLGRSMCTLAVVIVGVGGTLGKVSWGLAITVACGIAAVFGSAWIATYLMGTGLWAGTGAQFANMTQMGNHCM